jgi:hypothetical protein
MICPVGVGNIGTMTPSYYFEDQHVIAPCIPSNSEITHFFLWKHGEDTVYLTTSQLLADILNYFNYKSI